MKQKFNTALITSLIVSGCAGTVPSLGVRDGRLVPCPSTPNCVSSQAQDEDHFVEPILMTGQPLALKNRMVDILSAMPRSKIKVADENYIRVEFTSKVWRFVDDVEFYFSEGNVEETVVHVRSSSRLGRSDFGVNRERVEQIRNKLNTN